MNHRLKPSHAIIRSLTDRASISIHAASIVLRFLRLQWIVIIVMVGGGWWWLAHYNHPDNKNKTPTSQEVRQTTSPHAQTTDTSPDFATIIPTGKTADSLGGWTRVSPEKSVAAYAYTDKIGDITIIVTEQQLPDTFSNDVDNQVAELAKGYGATQRIPAEGASVYASNPAKGIQYVIASKYDLLILIKASSKISNDDWTSYFSSLR